MVVYIVGAGPGDIGLVTLKAKELVQRAEVIIYDKLANSQILDWAPVDCEMIYMGKREKDSAHSQTIQQRINDEIVQHGRDKFVVRLKGGDPLIFGRGGEEAQICAEAGIPFEIVPGISSAVSVPAYAGVPVTHRDFNSSITFLTGHESDKEGSSIEWERLPDNLVILMGVSQISSTAQKLMSAGRSADTSVAAIYSGTTPKQKTVMTTLGQLAEEGIDLQPPVIFVVGPVAQLHNELTWFEKKLSGIRGKKVALTRADTHMKESLELFEGYGMDVIPMPLIKIVSREFTIPDISNFDALVFTSLEGVKRVGAKMDLSGFPGRIFSIGPKTRFYIEKEWGVRATSGESFNSEGLAEHIMAEMPESSRILALRSSAATEVLPNILSRSHDYNEIPIYDIERLPADPDAIRSSDAVFIVSASCAKSISEVDPKILDGKTIISIGPETSKHLTMPHITARQHTIQGMVDTYMNYIWSGFP